MLFQLSVSPMVRSKYFTPSIFFHSPTSSGLSLSPCPLLFRQSWPAISQGPQSQHLPPLPCCHERCTPQTPPSWAAERSQSPCPSSPAGQGPQSLRHPDWWGLQSGSLVRCCCRKRKEKIRNCEIMTTYIITRDALVLAVSRTSATPGTEGPRSTPMSLPHEAQAGTGTLSIVNSCCKAQLREAQERKTDHGFGEGNRILNRQRHLPLAGNEPRL